jgi:hypothetical protein
MQVQEFVDVAVAPKSEASTATLTHKQSDVKHNSIRPTWGPLEGQFLFEVWLVVLAQLSSEASCVMRMPYAECLLCLRESSSGCCERRTSLARVTTSTRQ